MPNRIEVPRPEALPATELRPAMIVEGPDGHMHFVTDVQGVIYRLYMLADLETGRLEEARPVVRYTHVREIVITFVK